MLALPNYHQLEMKLVTIHIFGRGLFCPIGLQVKDFALEIVLETTNRPTAIVIFMGF